MKSPCLLAYKRDGLYLWIKGGQGLRSCRILEFSSRQKINFQPFILWKVHVFQVIKSFISQDCKGARGLAPWSLNNFCIFMLAGDWFWALSIMKEPSCISAYKRDSIHSVYEVRAAGGLPRLKLKNFGIFKLATDQLQAFS